MSRPGESANRPVQPNVYLPYVEADPPPYEAYRDPAAAHGWENAYDETSELPRIAEARAPHEYDPEVSGGRADRRRAARRPRRAVTALGAVGVVSVAALVAGFAFTSSSDDTEKGRPEGTRSAAAPDSAGGGNGGGGGESGSPSLSPERDAGRPAGAGTSPTGAESTPSPIATASRPPTTSPSATPTTSSTPSEASSAPVTDSGKGNPKGRGKRPR
ncbi:hypothetical protein NFX46_05120 [Streptomyces phaeoluteigriseus]|uniref:Uncharacterized protein n=1 Tax=Streptomyces phaeoluteigriseus TaxID=114686 RepID=A0ABY4Z2E3_9ACTN|nr:hypothetical protein [Streptomyces phaeoluteigriseus]USQ83214.1 hypothetical protein NFX46_05120 [Streptomyces phaeoluteigriseus]